MDFEDLEDDGYEGQILTDDLFLLPGLDQSEID